MNVNLSKDDLNQLKKDFQEDDKNNDGFIDKGELKLALKKLDPNYSDADIEKHVADTFKTVDKNNDGKISFNEYIKYVG